MMSFRSRSADGAREQRSPSIGAMRHVALASMLALAMTVPMSVPAAAAEAYGFWSAQEAPDGAKAGIVFPDYSPNDYAGLSLFCTPGTSTIIVNADSGKSYAQNAKVAVEIRAGATVARYSGKATHSEMDDVTRIEFTTIGSDPIFDAIATAKTLSVTVGGKATRLPVTSADKALAELRRLCGAQ